MQLMCAFDILTAGWQGPAEEHKKTVKSSSACYLESVQLACFSATSKATLIFSLVGLLWVNMQHKQAELQALMLAALGSP